VVYDDAHRNDRDKFPSLGAVFGFFLFPERKFPDRCEILRGPIPRASMGALTTKNVAGDKNDEYKNTLLPLMLGRQS
jgi:hypothetical protein